MTPFAFGAAEIEEAGRAELVNEFKDAEPLTDAVWISSDQLYCVRRRSGEADLVLANQSGLESLAVGIRVLQLGGRTETGLLVNSGTQILRWSGSSLEPLLEHRDGIASFDVSMRGDIVCVAGSTPRKRNAIVQQPGMAPELIASAHSVLRALWCGQDVLLMCAEEEGGTRYVSFWLWRGGRVPERLFRTDLFVRGEVVGDGRGQVCVSGGALGGNPSGCWILDPRDSPPFSSVVNLLPLGWPAFVGPRAVVFGANIVGTDFLVMAGTGRVLAAKLDGPAPRALSASPDGRYVAWARPGVAGGALRICRLLAE